MPISQLKNLPWVICTKRDTPCGTMNAVRLIGTAVWVSHSASGVPVFSLAGGRTQSQMYWVDGGTGQNLRLGKGHNSNLDPPVETIGEIEVLSNNNLAEYEGSAGGIIVQTTKSGTNQVHGSLYEYLRNDAMDAPARVTTQPSLPSPACLDMFF